MKKIVICITAFGLFACGSSFAQKATPPGLPELHAIKTVTLGPSYSCRAPEAVRQGYAETALFLSAYSKQRNSPDLLFNGACKADDDFQASTAGDDFSLIADLGAEVSLEDVSAARAFNLKRVHSDAAYSRFSVTARIIANHTYAVLLNGSDKRGLFVFTVAEYVPNERVVVRYAVKSYQVNRSGQLQSVNFDWSRTNN